MPRTKVVKSKFNAGVAEMRAGDNKSCINERPWQDRDKNAVVESHACIFSFTVKHL